MGLLTGNTDRNPGGWTTHSTEWLSMQLAMNECLHLPSVRWAAWRWSGAGAMGALEVPQPWVNRLKHSRAQSFTALRTAERYFSHLLLRFTFLSSFKPCLLFLHLWAPTHPQVIKILPLVYKYTASAPHDVHYELGPAVKLGSSGLLNEPVSYLCISGPQVLNFSPTYSLHDERPNSLAFLLKDVQQTFIHSLKFRFTFSI